jgi:hypothetical protein
VLVLYWCHQIGDFDASINCFNVLYRWLLALPSIDSISEKGYQMTTMFPVVKTVDAVIADGHIALPVSRTDGKKGKSGLCIVVPVVSDSVVSLVIQSDIGKAWLSDGIDTVRSHIASVINKAGNTITSDKLGIDGILAQMKLETESQRMTKEAIGVWFDADLAPLVSARIAEKMQGIAADKLAKLVDGYKVTFQTLAGRDVSMAEPIKAGLIKAMELLPAEYDHVIGNKVMEKLIDVSEATNVLAAL